MQGEEWPDEVKTRALALCLQTGNISEASRQLAQELGDDPAPPIRTVNVWVHKGDPQLFQQIANNKREILQSRWSDLELAAIDATEREIAEGKITGQSLAIVAGISADKRLKVEELAARNRGGQGLVAVLRMMKTMEDKMLGDGKTIEAQAIIAEGEMP